MQARVHGNPWAAMAGLLRVEAGPHKRTGVGGGEHNTS